MNPHDILKKVICDEEITSEQKEALVTALESDAELARSYIGWLQVRSSIRHDLPHTQDLVLYALAAQGHADDLSHDEASTVSHQWKHLDTVISSHPGLTTVTELVNLDREAFLECWEAESHQNIFVLPAVMYRIAAVIAIVSVTLFATLFLLTQRESALHMVVVDPGDYQSVQLPDSSFAHISGPATLKYDDEQFGRSVELTGRAFFDITHKPDQFIVRTDEAIVQVLGTRFAMRSMNDITQVILESGRVKVASNDTPPRSVTLLPGQMTDVVHGSAPSPSTAVNLEDELRWTGFIFLRNTSMRKAAVLISNSRNVHVDVDPSLINETVTGTFSPQIPIQEILDALSLTLNASVEKEGDMYQIVP
ncbi:MAG: FecR domain-containing protein [Bacteroidetes bacterium]|nr:FecR domain-containing protein [Bacteroidota bacterium]